MTFLSNLLLVPFSVTRGAVSTQYYRVLRHFQSCLLSRERNQFEKVSYGRLWSIEDIPFVVVDKDQKMEISRTENMFSYSYKGHHSK